MKLKNNKIGLIGTSWITKEFTETILKHNEKFSSFELEAIYSRTLTKANNFAQEYQIKGFSDFDLFLQTDFQILYIGSPHICHYDHVKAGLLNNKHVFCEKPLTLTENQAKELFELAEANELILMEGLVYLNNPLYLLIKEKLMQLGTIHYAEINLAKQSSKYQDYINGKLPSTFNKQMGGGAINDLAPYTVPAVIDLFGRDFKFSCKRITDNNNLDLTSHMSFDYDYLQVNALVSKVITDKRNCIIIGENGRLEFSALNNLTNLYHYSKDDQLISEHKNENQRMSSEIELFQELLNGNIDKYNYLKELSLASIKIYNM